MQDRNLLKPLSARKRLQTSRLSSNCRMADLDDFASSVAIVVSSCDKFFDAWRPFAFFFRKFWPDCPFPVYLIVNRLRARSKFLRPINTGKDQGWASRMEFALRQISAPYIFYMQEDYFLTAPVDRGRMAEDFAYVVENNADSLCFYGGGDIDPKLALLNDRFGIVPRDSSFRTVCQTTLWKRESLVAILRPGESVWEMEARGSERTRDFLCLRYYRQENQPISYFMSAIVRSLWVPEALELCRRHNFTVRPRFRLTDARTRGGRRFRRAIGRMIFPFAYARQLMAPIDLDL